MPEPSADHDQADPVRPDPPRRVVANWEYTTAYIPSFQVRMSAELHERLSACAKEKGATMNGLLIEILEEAVRHRAGQVEGR